MSRNDLTPAHDMAIFVTSSIFSLTAFWPPGECRFLLYPPTREPVCGCSAGLFDCSDFATQFEAQQCIDLCWVVRGFDVQFLDADFVAGEGVRHDLMPAGAEQKAAYRLQ